MVAGVPFLQKVSKCQKASYIKGFRVLGNSGCSLVVVASAARSSVRSAMGSPFTCILAAVQGKPEAAVGKTPAV